MNNDLRVPDLIAKMAHVTLKDTLRVLIASDLVAWHLDTSFEEMLSDAVEAGLSTARPVPAQVAACEQAYFTLTADLKKDAGMHRWWREAENFR